MNETLDFEDLERLAKELRPEHATYLVEIQPGDIKQFKLPWGKKRRYRDGTFLITTNATEAHMREALRQEAKDRPMLPDMALGYLIRVSEEESQAFFIECLKEIADLYPRFPMPKFE